MLKIILAGLTIAAVAGTAILTYPQPTEAFAFPTADGSGLLIYACTPHPTARLTARNAHAAHRFFEAQLAITADVQVAGLVADLDSNRAHRGLALFSPAGNDLHRDIARNLVSTYGCQMLKLQLPLT